MKSLSLSVKKIKDKNICIFAFLVKILKGHHFGGEQFLKIVISHRHSDFINSVRD